MVLRGGGIIFTIGLWIWSAFFGFQYPWLLAGVTLAAGISFVDDIHSLPDSLRLVVQFTAMFLVFQEIELLHWDMWWMVPLALIAAVGCTNIFNFMDGINGISAAYSLAMLLPLAAVNEDYNTDITDITDIFWKHRKKRKVLNNQEFENLRIIFLANTDNTDYHR